MDSCKKLKNIERIYDVNSIKFKNIEVWGLLRNIYHFELSYSKISLPYNTSSNKIQVLKRFLQNSIYGLPNFFRKYSYLIISTSSLRKPVRGKYYDKSFDFLIDYLGREKSLCLEYPNKNIYDHLEGHYKKTVIHTKYITSLSLLDLTSIIFEKFWFWKISINNYSTLEQINKSLTLSIPNEKFIKRFYIKYILALFILKIHNPKAIFINCFYVNQHFIFAAKKLGIPSIEIQHGAIGNTEAPYNFDISLNKSFFPDYLLSFGETDRNLISQGSFLNKENIIPIGNWFIDYQKSILKKGEKNTSILVTLQDIVEEKTINFILEVCALDPSLSFSLLPRGNKKIHKEDVISKVKQINILRNANFYAEIDKYLFHATVFSTTAIEAPSFNAYNIMIDIDQLASKRFSKLLSNEHTFFASSPRQFVSYYHANKEVRKINNESLIRNNFQDNLISFLKDKVL